MERCSSWNLGMSNASLTSTQVSLEKTMENNQIRKSKIFCQLQLFNKFEIREQFLIYITSVVLVHREMYLYNNNKALLFQTYKYLLMKWSLNKWIIDRGKRKGEKKG